MEQHNGNAGMDGLKEKLDNEDTVSEAAEANQEMKDQFYGRNGHQVRDILDVSAAHRSQS